MASGPNTTERGYSGAISWGGLLSSYDVDYADAWRTPSRWETIEKMRADPACSAVLSALTYPILSSELRVEPASDDPEDVRLAEFVEAGLHNMTTDLMTHRLEALSAVGDGTAVFETVYERREDGLYHLRKLARRPNRTLTHWHVDEHGGPDGVTQYLATGETVRLEMDQLLVFTHLREGGSLLGRPALRAMYRPWFLIDKLSRIGAIAVERNGVGLPWARYIGGSDDERSRLEQALMGLHAHERGFLIVDDDVSDVGFMAPGGGVVDPVPLMEYQRRDLFLSPLAQFLALGTDGTGSLALSRDHSSFFLMALRFIAAEIEDVYNRYLIPRWIGYNWRVDADRLPRIVHGSIDQRSATEWMGAIAQAVAAGVKLDGAEVSRVASEVLGIEPPPDEELEPDAPDAPDVADVNAPDEDETEPAAEMRAAGQMKSEIMLEALGVAVDFAGLETDLDKAELAIKRAVAPLQAKQARRVAAIARRVIERRDLEAVEGFEIESDEEAAAIQKVLEQVYGRGAAHAQRELDRQGVTVRKPGREEVAADLALLAALSAEMGRALADRMRTAWGAAVMRGLRLGRFDPSDFAETVTPAGERLLEDVARQGASAAVSRGRDTVTQANAEIVDRELYSAVLDESTCRGDETRCLENDGREFAVGEGTPAPNPNCRGRDRCRCIRIPIAKARADGTARARGE